MTKADVIAAISRAADKTSSARERKRSKDNATGYFTQWADSLMDQYGEEIVVNPTAANLAKLHRALNRINAGPAVKRLFIQSTINNWEIITPSMFKGMKVPESPNFDWFVKNIERYWQAYATPAKRGSKASRITSALASEVTQLRADIAERDAKIVALDKELAATKTLLRKAQRQQPEHRVTSKKGNIEKWH